MYSQNQKGFTIVELILFLALSGVFLLIALMGIGGRTSNVRFTDSVRSFESQLILQQQSTLTGVSPQGTGGGSSNNGQTILLGKYYEITPGSDIIDIYVITGNRLSLSSFSSSSNLRQLIYEARPEIKSTKIDEYQIQWGTVVLVAGNPFSGTLQHIRGYAFLRNPYGTQIEGYGLRASAPNDYFNNDNVFNPGGGYIYPAFSTHICLRSPDGRLAEIALGEGNADIDIEAVFDKSNIDSRLITLGCS